MYSFTEVLLNLASFCNFLRLFVSSLQVLQCINYFFYLSSEFLLPVIAVVWTLNVSPKYLFSFFVLELSSQPMILQKDGRTFSVWVLVLTTTASTTKDVTVPWRE